MDVAGNIALFKSVSVGSLSTRINSWLATRGLYLASKYFHSNTSESVSLDNRQREEDFSLGIVWQCLVENFGCNILSQPTTSVKVFFFDLDNISGYFNSLSDCR